MSSEPLFLNLSQNTKNTLQEIANATGLSEIEVAQDILDKYLNVEAWHIRAVQEGLRAVENGEVVTYEEAMKEFGIEN